MNRLIVLFCTGAAFSVFVGSPVFASTIIPTAADQPKAVSTRSAMDCSADYGGKTASCVKVPCGKLYDAFLGTWAGQFWAYEPKLSSKTKNTFRPYQDSVVYSADDCLKNTGNGDTFIVGHQTDSYPAFKSLPAKVEKGFLITGRDAKGTPFLRTVGGEGTYDYALAFKDEAAELTIWKLHLPAAGNNPPMTFTTIDARNFAIRGRDTRNVTVTMTVGPEQKPYFQSVLAYGSHTRQH